MTQRRTRGIGWLLRCLAGFGGAVGPAVVWRLSKQLDRLWAPRDGVYSIKAEGILWELDLQDTLQRHIFYTGGYEQALMREVTRRLRPTDIVLDVGANIGAFAVPVARRLSASGLLVAIEPAADAFKRLRRHISVNGLEKRVLACQLALGAEASVGALRERAGQARGDWGWRTLVGTGPVLEAVRVVCGDLLLEELSIPRVDVLKIDVEGFEAEVLAGLSSQFERCPPRVVVMELVERHQVAAGGSIADLGKCMKGYGYTGYWIRIRGLVAIEGSPRSGNAMFIRERK